MTYRLHLGPSIHAIYASLPDDGRRDIGVCLLDALADPLAHSAPYGVDDGIMRTLAHGTITIAVLLDHENKAITVVQIGYAG
ncbi:MULTISPECIES: hypothetical protein [Streptomyces]|uniref:Uncharacterized protein n=1 Tax=Streptomyces tricolor TaxID=68277 RepID=A0ABS9J810_9ACTN|nr:hypothetical protein [Streptomyces tricolor]MCG0061698.1 hypothetical protein [Streptomyces tricolor]MYU30669.1 hypothetical protein [Streptomyces sp. SID7810]CUW31743.1 hypothetical protein TUE45_06492 [Streptomyces reticuli]